MLWLLLAPAAVSAQEGTVAVDTRLAVLADNEPRFSADKTLLLQLAIARLEAGDLAQAVSLARDVIAIDEHEPAAWRILIDDARRSGDAPSLEALTRLPEIFAAAASTLIELAERLGAPGAGDLAQTTALRWLTDIPAPSASVHVARELVRARLLTNRGHAAAALDIVSALAAVDVSRDVRRLHAQLLGRNGHYMASLEAYDVYLALAPDDLEARREQARVAGWAQQFSRARRLYADIDEIVPVNSGPHAEADAKRLFYDLRWRDAERAYARWLSVEPLNEEATFEYAEILVAQGRLREAREVYERLSPPARPHEVAYLARRALEEPAAPSAGLNGAYVSSSGYDGQRLLQWSEAAGHISLPLFGDSRQKLDMAASSLVFSNRAIRLPAYAAKASASTAHRWGALHGTFALVRGARSLSYGQGRAEAAFSVRHDFDLRVGMDRTPLLENISTVRDGVVSWGPSVAMLFTRPELEMSLAARGGWVASNLEKSASASGRRRVRSGTSNVWAVGGITHHGWRESDDRSYSPQRFSRVDFGAEWVQWLRVPRFRVDRRTSLTMRYLAGVDSNGDLYHQPHAHLSLEHRRVGIDSEVSWVESSVYRSLTLRLAVRIGG